MDSVQRDLAAPVVGHPGTAAVTVGALATLGALHLAKPRVVSWAMRPHEFDLTSDTKKIPVKPASVVEGLHYRAMEARLIR
jgi:hypothetical protein